MAAAILQEMDVDFAAQITKKISAVKNNMVFTAKAVYIYIITKYKEVKRWQKQIGN